MTTEKEKAVKNIGTVVRALTVSTKPPVTLMSILRDYKGLEGEPLPFRKLGYATAEDLLLATGEFIIRRFGDEVIITAKYNAKTEHIASMVREQKSTKSKPAKFKSNYSSNYGYNNNNNNNKYQSNYQQQQQYRRPAPQQQHYHHHPPQQQSYYAPPPNSAQLLSQELNRVRQQQENQLNAQRRFEESRQIQQSQLDQLKSDLIRQKANLEKELKDRIAQELQTRINTELQARIDKEVEARLEKQLEAFKKQQERELKAQAGRLEKLKENLKFKEWQEEERTKAKSNKEVGTKEVSGKEDITKKDSTKEDSKKEDITEKDSTKEDSKKEDITEKNSTKEDSTKSKPKEQERNGLSREQEMEKDRVPKPRVPAPAPTRASVMDKETILITIPNDKNALAMNGHSQSRVQTNGQAKQNGGNPPLRAILGNSASQRPFAPGADADATRFKRTLHPRVVHSGQVRSPAVSVNDRLKLKAPPQAPTPTVSPLTPPHTPENAKPKVSPQSEDVLRVTSSVPKSNSCTPNSSKAVNFKFDPKYDAISLLNMYCAALGLEKPTFTCFGSPPQLHCSVRIEGDVYSSYPGEFVNEEMARLRTAEIAVQRIQHAQSRRELSVCTVNDEEFVEGLYQELMKYPHGILGHKLEDWYGKTFGHHLPSHWYDLIIESNKIRVEHGINPRIILFANDPGSPEPIRINTPTKMPELALPWHLNGSGSTDWMMYISHCNSTNEVWAQLIDQLANLQELKTHMSRYMAVPHFRQQVLDPHVQELYLVEIRDGWHRVRVISVDAEQRTCRCHFVDFGDVAVFSFEELFQCATQFLVLPAQGICLSMYALDKFRDHPHAQGVLMSELVGHKVVVRLVTSQSKYFEQGGAAQGIEGKGKRQACLAVTLYDTSTAEDIHLNDLVASRIIESTPAPTLNGEQHIGKTTPVLVTHITEDGDLMVLLRNDDLKFVERSIATTVADLGEQDRVRYSDLLHDRHVFVCDESAGGLKQWYRGRLVAKPENPEEETFDIYYVDDGRQRKTHISNIYRLEANNRALASYPPQALAVRLHDVPEIAGQMLGRLRGLMPSRSEALLKVVAQGGTKPLVNIFIRGQDPESMYMCVNIGLRMEFEIQSTSRPDSLDDLHLNATSIQLPRRGSFSSVISSQSSGSDLVVSTPPATPQRSGATTFSTLLLKDYEAIPAVGAYFEVRVALSVNPGHFAVQPYKCYNQLQCLMKDLQEYCKGTAAKGVQPSQLAIGEAYAAPDSEGVYHRVNIRKIYDEIIHVRFVDVGDDGVVACDQLKTLPPELRKLPKMALPAQLYGIQLADVVWSQENCVRFRKLTLGRMFIGIVRGLQKHKDETRALCLELVDTSTPQDIKLHETLISENHAQPETKEV